MSQRRYKVIGTQPVHGHPPGDTFTASLDADDERYLKEIGAIRVVGGRAPKAKVRHASVEKATERLTAEQEAAKRTPGGEAA